MLICALAVIPIVFAAQTSDLRVAVVLIGIAAAAHQGWSCNLFTTTSGEGQASLITERARQFVGIVRDARS
jgi:hypothetical protein